MEILLTVILPILGILIVTPFGLFLLAKNDLFFTRIETGDIKFVVRGDSLVKIVHDVRGRRLTRDGTFEDGEEKKSFLNTRLGIWWIGIPPFAKIHKFPIKKERENPSAEKVDEWIDVGKEEIVSSLRSVFPRPYTLKKVELKDRLSVDVLVVAKFEVVKPYIPVFLFKGRFFENAGSILRAQVADILNDITLDHFIKEPKGEVGGILKKMKENQGFNEELVRQVGLKLVGISITQYDPSDDEIRNAIQAKQIAIQKGQGRIAEAEANAKVTKTNASAKAEAEERLAQARGVRIKETVTNLMATGGNADVVALQVGKVLQAEALASETSKMTTWVDGSANTQTVIPIGGDKK